MSEWRFRNLIDYERKGGMDFEVERCLAIIQGNSEQARGKAWKESFPPQKWEGKEILLPMDHNILEVLYAYGASIEDINRGVKWVLYYWLGKVDAFLGECGSAPSIDICDRHTINDYGMLFPFCFCYLIEDQEMLLAFKEKIDEVLSKDLRNADERLHCLPFVRCIAEDDIPKDIVKQTDEILKKKFWLEGFKLTAYMARRDQDGFNNALEEVLAERFGSERTRKRKKDQSATHLVSIWDTAVLALALHHGMKIKVKDLALPIWEFPIAQRPEIKALLPE